MPRTWDSHVWDSYVWDSHVWDSHVNSWLPEWIGKITGAVEGGPRSLTEARDLHLRMHVEASQPLWDPEHG